jgi:hypothetical protein
MCAPSRRDKIRLLASARSHTLEAFWRVALGSEVEPKANLETLCKLTIIQEVKIVFNFSLAINYPYFPYNK